MRIYNTHINSRDDAIRLQTGFKLPMEVDWPKAHSMQIAVNAHSVCTQTMQINWLPMCITFIVWTCLKTIFMFREQLYMIRPAKVNHVSVITLSYIFTTIIFSTKSSILFR